MQEWGTAVCEHLNQYHQLVMATIISQSGSAPRTAGARMLILPDGSIFGTIGGGRYEAEAIQAGLKLHRSLPEITAPVTSNKSELPLTPQPGCILEFSLHGVSDMDMICGGELTLLLEVLSSGSAYSAALEAASSLAAKGRPYLFLSRVLQAKQAGWATDFLQPVSIERYIMVPPLNYSCAHTENLAKLPEGCRLLPQNPVHPLPPAIQLAAACQKNGEPHWLKKQTDESAEYLLEYFPPATTVHIFGAGHVAAALGNLLPELGFRVIVLDDRKEFAYPERFPKATTIVSLLNQEHISSYLHKAEVDAHHALVIVTRGHAGDRDVLAAALNCEVGYIGMIGSQSKRDHLYAVLKQEGFNPESLNQVHCPIGLDIGAETPEEIAVSIAAELIAWKRNAL